MWRVAGTPVMPGSSGASEEGGGADGGAGGEGGSGAHGGAHCGAHGGEDFSEGLSVRRHHTFDLTGRCVGLCLHTTSFHKFTEMAVVMDGGVGLESKLEIWNFFHNRNPVALGALLDAQ